MSEKASYNPAVEAPAPPSYEQYSVHTAPIAESAAQQPRSSTNEASDIQMQNLSPQVYVTTSPQTEKPRGPFGPHNPSPQMYPPQPQTYPVQQLNQYPTAVALHALQRNPQVVDCPMCGRREMTQTQAVTGNTTHGWAAVLCCCAGIGCIPYIAAMFKDVNHMCGSCGHLLATYHNSGHTVVHKTPEPK
ncbi:LITAF-like zinc ribbon domain-containing protein [Aspergillus pseudoustus]|uniref:LITAF-like zinc ribbon domain-containing protein n=1 Tax=Aspergillus pseudoustus TaxID=1810923 RepID=A0ABR4JL57_9EURO